MRAESRASRAAIASRRAIDTVFLGLNVYLGNYIGEFVGELALNAFFVLVGFAWLRSTETGRWLGVGGIVVGAIGWHRRSGTSRPSWTRSPT